VKRLLPPLQRQLVLDATRATRLVGRQRAQDVDQLARTDGGREVAASPSKSAVVRTWISRSEVVNSTRSPGLADQHVGQDGQGVATLDDAATACRAFNNFSCAAFKTII
jgi:hypothetical protein